MYSSAGGGEDAAGRRGGEGSHFIPRLEGKAPGVMPSGDIHLIKV